MRHTALHTSTVITALLVGVMCLVGLPLGSTIAAAQDGDGAAAAVVEPVVEFPFENVGTKLFVEVTLNDSEPLSFILDTGCPPAFVIDYERAKALELELQNEEQVHTGAGEGKLITSARAPGVTLNVHGAIMPDQDASVLQLDHVSEFIGRRVDGLLGNGFFKHFIMEIDYAEDMIRLYRRGEFEYTGPGRRISVQYDDKWVMTRADVFIPGKEEPVSGRFVVDTGAGGAVHFTRPFVERTGMLEADMKTVSAAFAGAGGDVSASICRIAGVQWGPFRINEPVATLAHDQTGFFGSASIDGVLGAQILKRCRVIFDHEGGSMILEPYPNDGNPEPYEAGMCGVFLIAKGPDYRRFIVKAVQPDTPAGEAGLQVGDEIRSINGEPASEFALVDILKRFRNDGEVITLEIERNGERIPIEITLRRLVMTDARTMVNSAAA